MSRHVASNELRMVGPEHPQWDDYVKTHPKGTIFHTRAMAEAFGATEGFQTCAIAAVDSQGSIVAMLVCCHVVTLSRLSRVASRSIQFAEPLCDASPLGVTSLTQLLRWSDCQMRSKSLLSEIRLVHPQRDEIHVFTKVGYTYSAYLNFLVDTSNSIPKLWDAISPKRRQKIRSSKRKGVLVRDDRTPDGVSRLHRMMRLSYRRAQVPLLPESLFQNVLKMLPSDSVRLGTAFWNDRPVASILCLLYKDRVFSWCGGTERIRGISPFACIVWEDIAFAHEHGFAVYDFGGAGRPGEPYGPRDFKASFGGTKVDYGRYSLTYSRWRLVLANCVYGISKKVGFWSRG
jgi:serine/alanine adding enzyme